MKVFACSLRIKRHSLFKDFLPEEVYFEPSECLSDNSKSCSPNNICGERLSAHHKLRTGSNFLPETIEGTIMYGQNLTQNWLSSKTENEQHKIIATARSERKKNVMNKATEYVKTEQGKSSDN